MSVPTVSPAELLSYILSHAVTALAATQSFQDLVGAADATEALQSIYLDYISLQDENELASVAPMPRAIVRLNEEANIDLTTSSNGESSGPLQIILEATVPEDYQQASNDSAADRKAKINAEVLWWLNVLSGIQYQLRTAGLAGGSIVPYRIGIVQGRVHPEENDGVPYRWGKLEIDWRSQGR